MATLPLPNQSPGGYQWWHFDAENEGASTRVVVDFFVGCFFLPEYQSRYRAYLHAPTRNAPPVPGEFPCVHAAVYSGGRESHITVAAAPGPSPLPSPGVPGERERESRSFTSVKIGKNELVCRDGEWVLHFEGAVGADLVFRSRWPAAGEAESNRVHHWVVAGARCEVTGTIVAAGQKTEFAGIGYHDRREGRRPLGPELRRWMHGRVMRADETAAFTVHSPRQWWLGDEAELIIADQAGFRRSAGQAIVKWTRPGFSEGAFPKAVDLGPALSLREPRVIAALPWCTRLTYEAFVNGEITTAFCESFDPGLLRRPFLRTVLRRKIESDLVFER